MSGLARHRQQRHSRTISTLVRLEVMARPRRWRQRILRYKKRIASKAMWLVSLPNATSTGTFLLIAPTVGSEHQRMRTHATLNQHNTLRSSNACRDFLPMEMQPLDRAPLPTFSDLAAWVASPQSICQLALRQLSVPRLARRCGWAASTSQRCPRWPTSGCRPPPALRAEMHC